MDGRPAERCAVFLSYTWADVAEVRRIEDALRASGLTVFRDINLPAFDGITDGLARAVDSATVFLAFYSARFPHRYACQWELTRAFLAAQRLGDPRDRILVINPEPDETHIAPVELTDAGYFQWSSTADVSTLVARVAAKVAAAAGTPLGGVSPQGGRGLDERIARPRRFVGRYPDLWSVHSALHGGRLRAVRPPQSHPVVVVKAPVGAGKTSLAEQYAFLFQDAYPGGVVWTSLAGGGRTVRGPAVVSEFAVAVRDVAEQRFRLDLTGLDPVRMRVVLGQHLSAAGQDVLWVVDDLPAGLEPDVLDQLVIPSPVVHTVLTARSVTTEWPVPVVELGGMSVLEGEELFRVDWPALDRTERDAVAHLVARCGGHPFVLAAAARDLRAAQGTGAAELFAHRLDQIAVSVVDVLVDQVRRLSHPARIVLGFASTLAQAPFGGDLVVDGVAPVLGSDAAAQVADALAELDDHSLLRRLDRGPGGRNRLEWQLHALVGAAVRRDLDGVFVDAQARRAAIVLSDRLAGAGAQSIDLHQHAREIAACPAVPLDHRIALLRTVAAAHEDRGDVPAARDATYEVVRMAGPARRTEDVLTAARLAVTAGDYEPALEYVDQVIEQACRDGDVRAEYLARFLAASAHELRGHYPLADEVFHDHPTVRAQGIDPAWMSSQERQRVRVARVASLRLRGEYRAALELLPSIRREHRHRPHRGVWPAAMLELARLRLLHNEVRRSRQAADEVIAAFGEAGLGRHYLCREAVGVRAEADLAVALTEIRSREDAWAQATDRIASLLADSEQWYGPDNPLTLSLAVTHGRALLGRGLPDPALVALTAVEQRIAATLGADHPLHHRAQWCSGLARFQRGEYDRAREIFADLLPRQVHTLGRDHPESLMTRAHLGGSLALTGDRRQAVQLLSEARRMLRRKLGWRSEYALMALSGQMIVVLPKAVVTLALAVERKLHRPPR